MINKQHKLVNIHSVCIITTHFGDQFASSLCRLRCSPVEYKSCNLLRFFLLRAENRQCYRRTAMTKNEFGWRPFTCVRSFSAFPVPIAMSRWCFQWFIAYEFWQSMCCGVCVCLYYVWFLICPVHLSLSSSVSQNVILIRAIYDFAFVDISWLRVFVNRYPALYFRIILVDQINRKLFDPCFAVPCAPPFAFL